MPRSRKQLEQAAAVAEALVPVLRAALADDEPTLTCRERQRRRC